MQKRACLNSMLFFFVYGLKHVQRGIRVVSEWYRSGIGVVCELIEEKRKKISEQKKYMKKD